MIEKDRCAMDLFRKIFPALCFFLCLLAACDDLHGKVTPPSGDCDRCRACRAKLAEDTRLGRDCESVCWSKRNREYLDCKSKTEAWHSRCVTDCGADAGTCVGSCREIAWNVMNEKCSRLQRQECFCNSSETLCDCRGCDTPAPTP